MMHILTRDFCCRVNPALGTPGEIHVKTRKL